MKVRTGGRTIEIPDERVRGGVGGVAIEPDSQTEAILGVGMPDLNSRKPVSNPALSPHIPDERVRGGAVGSATLKAPILDSGVTARQAGSSPAPSPYHPYKSKLEARFARSLEFDRLGGLIAGFAYEPFNIRLSGSTNFYKPDFFVWGKAMDEKPIFYEVKGRNKSDDRSLVKLKMAATLHPWARFILMKYVRGTFVEREIYP